jgi:hypothetical protein
MTQVAISAIKGSPTFQHELALRRSQLEKASTDAIVKDMDEVTSAIREKTLAAARRLGVIVDDASAKPSDQIRAAAELLDRGGYPKVVRTEERKTVAFIDATDVATINETLHMLAGDANTIDAVVITNDTPSHQTEGDEFDIDAESAACTTDLPTTPSDSTAD